MKYTAPQGCRDLMPEVIQQKEKYRQAIQNVLRQAGCAQISTPAIEYYQTYAAAFSDPDETEMYKFYDTAGNILVLRMDMTVPIARMASTKFKNERTTALMYCEDVFKVRHTFQGRRSQITDCGAEFIGLPKENDTDILKLAADVMDSLDLEDWTLEIGDVRYFQTACTQLNIDKKTQQELAALIDQKSLPDLAHYLNEHEIPQKDFFLTLPLSGGGQTALETAYTQAFSPELKAIIAQLDEILLELEDEGYGNRITVDLGKVPHLNYYTSTIFEGYAANSGFAILNGGRYDNLLATFGNPKDAIGFSVKLDYLTDTQEEHT